MRAKILCGVMAVFAGAWAAAEGPLVIAHRGASGYLPEETLEAYAMAYAMGADYLEPDLVYTKDKVFICRHDRQLDDTTDVEQKFPDRKQADGHWYASDFTFAEIKTLNAEERLRTRFPQGAPGFQVPSFEELVQMVQGLNKVSGKNIGVYPELKDPAWHEKAGMPMERAALDLLAKYGYTEKDSKVFLQCFEAEPLKKVRELGARIQLILLVGNGKEASQDLSEAGLDAIAKYANGIGPDKSLVEKDPKLVQRAHAHGLAVHPYTFRTDDYNKGKYASYDAEIQQFVNVYKIDGFFTDQSDRGRAALDRMSSPLRRGMPMKVKTR